MGATRPELIFLSGPQKGRRAVLMESVVVAGRSNQAEMLLSESSISRQQLQFSFTEQGWIVENLSAGTPLLVNGKRFRRRKQLLLATGDVLGVGVETKMLFVDSGDDPTAALSEWKQAHPAPAPPPVVQPEDKEELPAPAPPPETDDLLMLEPQQAPPPPTSPIPGQDDDAPADPAAEAQQAKLKKYALIGGIYLVVMVVIFSLLMLTADNETGPTKTGQPEQLTDEQIRGALESEIKRSYNDVAAALALSEARELFPQRFSKTENLYLCSKKYRLYLAYRRPGDRYFESPMDETNYHTVTDELVEKVQGLYSDAYFFARGGKDDDAKNIFDRLLLEVLPFDQTQDDPQVRKTLVEHFRIYLDYVSQSLGKKKKK